MARDLQGRPLMDALVLMTSTWCIVLYFFAVLVSMVVVDIEWRHGRNRARSNKHGQTCLAQFTGKYVGGEASEVHNAQVARNKIARSREQGSLHAGASSSSASTKHVASAARALDDLVRAPTAFSLWRRDAIRRDQELGRLHNPCSKSDWALRIAEWASSALDDAKSRYEQEAKLLGVRAAINRKRMQADAKVGLAAAKVFIDNACLDNLAAGDVGTQLAIQDSGGLSDAEIAIPTTRPWCGCKCAGDGQQDVLVKGYDDQAHPVYMSLNVASGFSVEGDALGSGRIFEAAATVASRMNVEEKSFPLSAANL